MSLGYDLSRPPGSSEGSTVAVLLHGRGSHRGDLQALRSHLPDAWALITPQAPHPGHAWGYGPGWAWYRYLGEDRVEREGLAQSLEALDSFLQGLPTMLGSRPGRVVLGGFSQGGTVSLAYALRHPGAVSAVLNFSGFLAATPLVDLDGDGVGATPVFWGHGTRDPNIPFALAARGRQRLTKAGGRLVVGDYDIGHWIDPAEVEDAVSFVASLPAPGLP
ncbi:MAG: alpha/beta fold hydrolase [Gemmatimonadota bacterium]|jgi:phospholipase/carboxylesterase